MQSCKESNSKIVKTLKPPLSFDTWGFIITFIKTHQMAKKVFTDRKPPILTPRKVSLYPNGEASEKSVDSLKATNPKLSKLIGSPSRKYPTSQAGYGEQSSDIIKKALNKK